MLGLYAFSWGFDRLVLIKWWTASNSGQNPNLIGLLSSKCLGDTTAWLGLSSLSQLLTQDLLLLFILNFPAYINSIWLDTPPDILVCYLGILGGLNIYPILPGLASSFIPQSWVQGPSDLPPGSIFMISRCQSLQRDDSNCEETSLINISTPFNTNGKIQVL